MTLTCVDIVDFVRSFDDCEFDVERFQTGNHTFEDIKSVLERLEFCVYFVIEFAKIMIRFDLRLWLISQSRNDFSHSFRILGFNLYHRILFHLLFFSDFAFSALSIEGTYQGKNLYVQNPIDDEGKTPVDYAVENNKEEVRAYLEQAMPGSSGCSCTIL